ncbi:hypothetical protein L1987_09490 [Smallanthus sonchifolius]|uniref:Uncharacterized protein n=1 Tax=Smallanthus sonchifolius TaxID=185202 RepID=A0ACB9JNZ0_9ASTR|nr:hypothetical protein L1987_09490 [Smallanthus sonchifolius]
MSYYSKSKTELAKIGAEGFAHLDDLCGGHKSNTKYSSSAVSAPPTEIPNLFHYQHQRRQSYVVRQQVYTTQVHAARIETVVDCYEAAKRYGGTVVVDYAKRKPTRKGFFY